MNPLSDSDIQAALSELSDWQYINNSLTKTYILPTFIDAISLVNGIAELAEEQGHHPDIDIRYNRVTVTLSTHDAGTRVTGKDMLLARAIEEQATTEVIQEDDSDN